MVSQLRVIGRRLSRHRSTRLTSEGIQFLLFTVAVGVAAINTGNNLFYLLLAMMLSIVLMSGLVAEHCLRRLEFHRHLPELLFANEPATATLVVKNAKSKSSSFSIRLFDVVDGQDIDRGLSIRQLLPGTSQLLSYPLMATTRGCLKFEGVRVVTSFPFGLFLKKAYYPVPGSTAVCPQIRPLADDLLEDPAAAGHEHHVHRRGPGNDLYNLRLYHSGDDSRNIHWVTTARTSKLMVRETETEQQRRAKLYLATEAPFEQAALFEDAVIFTASLIAHLADRGYQLSLTVGDYRSLLGEGDDHIIGLMRALALCKRHDSSASTSGSEASAEMDVEPGALILIRASHRAEGPENPTFLFDMAVLAEASHVV